MSRGSAGEYQADEQAGVARKGKCFKRRINNTLRGGSKSNDINESIHILALATKRGKGG